jgi:hypothetical protein
MMKADLGARSVLKGPRNQQAGIGSVRNAVGALRFRFSVGQGSRELPQLLPDP